MKSKGKIIFISGPSGVGKGTLINGLRNRHPEFLFPPSCTTREPRPGEIDGKTYYFISQKEFEQKIEEGEFLEYAHVHGGHLYGTLRSKLIEGVEAGKVVIREFDVQGYQQARERLPREVFASIFLMPHEDVPSLVHRIRARAPITDEEVKERIKSMEQELKYSEFYDHILVSEEGKIDQLIVNGEKLIAKIVSGEAKVKH